MMNYYRRYPGDYARDTAHLSLAEHGAYCLLLDYCYSRESLALPGTIEGCYRICKAISSSEQAAVRAVVEQFFPHGCNGRVGRQLPEEQVRIGVARTNGALGGRPPGKKAERITQQEPTGLSAINPAGSIQQTHSQTRDEPSSEPIAEPTPKALQSPTPTPDPTPSPDRKSSSLLLPGGLGGEKFVAATPAAPPKGTPGLNQTAFAEWDCERRRRGGKSKTSWTAIAQGKAAKILAQHNASDQQAMVDASIAAGWQGLFPLNGKTFKQLDEERDEARMRPIREGFIARHGPKPTINGEVLPDE